MKREFLYLEDERGVLEDFYSALTVREDYSLDFYLGNDQKSWITNFSETSFHETTNDEV